MGPHFRTRLYKETEENKNLKRDPGGLNPENRPGFGILEKKKKILHVRRKSQGETGSSILGS